MSRDRTSAGFTLVEVLVVLSVIALVTAVSAPLLRRPSSALRVEAIARELAAELRLLRARSIARNVETEFVMDFDAKTYLGAGPEARRLPVDLMVDMEVAASHRQGASAGIRFFPDGGASGGSLRLQSGQSNVQIDVNWLTGEAQIKRGATGK